MNGWQKHVVATAAEEGKWIAPAWNGSEGVPYCSDECPYHDGKRCEILGCRPDGICEPAVTVMAKELDAVWR